MHFRFRHCHNLEFQFVVSFLFAGGRRWSPPPFTTIWRLLASIAKNWKLVHWMMKGRPKRRQDNVERLQATGETCFVERCGNPK